MNLKKMASHAKTASYALAAASTGQKNAALEAVSNIIQARKQEILEANLQDIAAAKENGLAEAMIDRLSLQSRLDEILHGLQQIIKLPDPIGEKLDEKCEGPISLAKYRTPIGVLGVIYESRPNVTLDISALAIKSGNTVILRGGKEMLLTNESLVKAIQTAINKAGLPEQAIQLVASSDRQQLKKMLRLHESIDLIIPRGGGSLQEFCRKNSSIPVITGGIGICHLFAEESADLEKSLKVVFNAKIQRPTVCNALDTLLVQKTIAEIFIPKVITALGLRGVAFKLDELSMEVVKKHHQEQGCQAATPKDWQTEWLSLTLSIKVVENLEEAIAHIRAYSSGHSDGILTENREASEKFISSIDSAAVYVNASTRFTDGSQFGLGAEVAISTHKLHARGPMGLNELTSYKWVVRGDYAVRAN